MLCASGFEFEKKLRLAWLEQETAQRALQSGSSQGNSKRFEAAARALQQKVVRLYRAQAGLHPMQGSLA
jgi:hypothetical protein